MSKRPTRNRHSDSTMSSALKRVRTFSVVFVFLEVAALAAFLICYFYDIPEGFASYILPIHWAIIAAGALVLNAGYIWLVQLRLTSIRQKSDLEAAAIIGSDVQEAYNFGQLGLIVTDDKNIVMWANNLFKDRQIDLLDKDIFEWQPALKDLQNSPSDMVVKIEVNSRNYDVRFLSEANLYIFKDTTDYESIFAYSREQATVIGQIIIDNYTDIAGKTEDDNNDLVTKVRAVIFEYAKEHGVLLRRYRGDSYFAICNFAALGKMERDNFAILGKVRALGKGQNVIPTLSMGFAHGFPDVNRLNEMASNGIDIAVSRGGDQAVVSHYGEDLKFYGGKTAAVENTSRVQFRSVADSIIGIIKGASNVIVSGHMDMDMDALGACLGIMAICDWCKKPCQIVYDPRLTEKKTRFAFQTTFPKADFERMTVTPREAEERIRSSTLFVVVDVSVPELVMGKGALEKAAKTIVIDHHRRGASFIDRPVLTYVDPSASSASEIVAEFIHYATANPRIEMSPSFATLMLSGMFLDTNFFKAKSTGIRSFEAAEILKEFGADNQRADDYLKDDYEEYALVTEIVSTMKTPYPGVVYCACPEKEVYERATLSKVANQLLQLKGINACFVIGRVNENEARISARSDGTVNVQLLCEKMGGGGHFAMAAVALHNTSVSIAESKLIETLDTYLNQAKTDMGGKKE